MAQARRKHQEHNKRTQIMWGGCWCQQLLFSCVLTGSADIIEKKRNVLDRCRTA
jgi:hypothetical protein